MVMENITSYVVPDSVLNQITSLTRLFQAIGGLIIAYLIFNFINVLLNKKKKNELRKIRETVEKINEKLGNKKKKN
jgi:signal transduction histidine kinase